MTYLELLVASPNFFGALVYLKLLNYIEFHIIGYHNNEVVATEAADN